jgi:two-component system chemotaxis response regulator CheB
MSSTRVLICDDSKTYAAALTKLLERDGEIDVVGVCETAEQAITRLRQLKPDVVTMDLELPGMSGMTAVEQIMSDAPVPILVLSGHVRERSETALTALAAGALDAMPKHGLDLRDPDGPAAKALRHRVKALSRARVIRHPRASLNHRNGTGQRATRTATAIGICASAGGPAALATLLGSLPATFPVPILLVQHISIGFVEGFVRWLDSQVPLPVRLATDEARLQPGIWVAPDGAHLLVDDGGKLALDVSAPTKPELHRPSGDVLLGSLAANCGGEAVAVVLTGMGRDGAQGLGAVRESGGMTIAQDEESSAVFGMPRAAAERGAEFVLPLERIASTLCRLTLKR